MNLTITYLNERIELLDGVYDQERQDELRALSRLYNRILGPVTSVKLHRPELLDLSMYSSSCNHSPIGALMRDLIVKTGIADIMLIPAGGKGAGMQQPFLGALGEIAERLLGVLHFEAVLDRLVYASYEELMRQGRRALGPDELPLFAPEQYACPEFAYVPFRPDSNLGWIEGGELLTGDAVLVPAQLVLMYYKHRITEARIGYPTTGGLAFHCDRHRAILHGLYEFIERDAINLRWYCRLAPPRIEVNLVDFLARYLDVRQARMSTPFIDGIRFYLNTLDVPIPIVTAMAVDQSRRERAFLGGGGAWSTRERAMAQALLELAQSRTALKSYKFTGVKNIQANSDLSEMSDFFDAILFFGYAENLPKLSWYTDGNQVVPWEDLPTLSFNGTVEEYDVALDWLRASGLRPIVLDFSGACWPEVSVTKVFVPQLTQACVPSHPYLGHPRFYELPQRLGMADRTLEFRDLNPGPVPLP